MDKKEPLISIVITTYKRTESLIKAIESAIDQTYENKEIIVIDDNLENSIHRNQVEKIMVDYPDIRYIKNAQNMGGAFARNVGIEQARGEFIAFLDDDDTFRSNKLQDQFNYYKESENENIGLVYSYSSEVDEFGKEIGIFNEDHEGIPIYYQMLGCIAGTSLWFCPKKVLVDVGMFEDSPNKQDSILLLKILINGYNIIRVPKILVNYTEHENDRISGQKPKNIIGISKYRNLCRNNYYLLKANEIKNIEYNFSKQLITLYLIDNNIRRALKELTSMVKIKPFHKNTVSSLIKCTFPHLYLKRINK